MFFWICGIVATGFLFFVIGYVAADIERQKLQEKFEYLHQNTSADHLNYLNLLKRETAQILFSRNPNQFLNFRHRLSDQFLSLAEQSEEQIKAEISEVRQRRQFFTDFDEIGTTDWEQYEDYVPIDRLQECYSDICLFSVQLKSEVRRNNLKAELLNFASGLEDQMSELIDDASRYTNTLAMNRVREAMKVYRIIEADRSRIYNNLHQSDIEFDYKNVFLDSKFPVLFQSDEFKIVHVDHVVEHVFGIHFPKFDEFYTERTFYDDKAFRSYERTNENFEIIRNDDFPLNRLNAEFLPARSPSYYDSLDGEESLLRTWSPKTNED